MGMDVTICLVTYNHGKYVKRCLDSLLKQKTNFEFEILVHDDCSTDNTIEILREYKERFPQIINLDIEEENKFSQGIKTIVLQLMLPKARGKYVALCEGDDYWCDVNKLQKQFICMEHEQGASICTHATQIIEEDGVSTGKRIPERAITAGDLSGEDMLDYILLKDTHLFHTSSMFFRKSIFDDVLESLPAFMKISFVEDRILMLFLATRGSIFFIDEIMSCYRVMSAGSWSLMVSSSRKKAYESDLEIIEMIKAFDDYTQNKYHQKVEQHLTTLYFRTLQYEMNYGELVKARYHDLFQTLGNKQKVYYSICGRIKFIGSICRNIKMKSRMNDDNH